MMPKFLHEWYVLNLPTVSLPIISSFDSSSRYSTVATQTNTARWVCKLCGATAVYDKPNTDCPALKGLSDVMDS